jgi:hypothetical protein
MIFDKEPRRGTINFMDGEEILDPDFVEERQEARDRVIGRIEPKLRAIVLEELDSPFDTDGMSTEELIEELTDKEITLSKKEIIR